MTTQNKKNRKRAAAKAPAKATGKAAAPAEKSAALQRALLRKAYLYVVGGWALGTKEVAAGIAVQPPVATSLLKALEAANLIVGHHVNEEKAITWQSYYDIENEDATEVMRKARADFNKAFPTGRAPIPAPVKTDRKGASGPQYTDEQLKTVEQARKDGLSWKAAAAKAGIKSPGYLSKTMKARGVK